jgi:nucleotide-binding universal stress UspA family protein
MYDTILVPTDGSAGTERVVAHAEQLARVHDASIHALYVIDATSFTGLPMEASWEGIREPLERQGETALEEVQRLVSTVPVETTTVEGTPSREIVRFARERPVDVVVMGTHGPSGIDRLLLGSVAERVVRGAPVPVVTVSVGDPGRPDENLSTEPAAPGPT